MYVDLVDTKTQYWDTLHTTCYHTCCMECPNELQIKERKLTMPGSVSLAEREKVLTLVQEIYEGVTLTLIH